MNNFDIPTLCVFMYVHTNPYVIIKWYSIPTIEIRVVINVDLVYNVSLFSRIESLISHDPQEYILVNP